MSPSAGVLIILLSYISLGYWQDHHRSMRTAGLDNNDGDACAAECVDRGRSLCPGLLLGAMGRKGADDANDDGEDGEGEGERPRRMPSGLKGEGGGAARGRRARGAQS